MTETTLQAVLIAGIAIAVGGLGCLVAAFQVWTRR